MRARTSRVASFAALVTAALALGACGGKAEQVYEPGLLVGTWTYSGSVPDIVTVHVTFDADKTFTFVETVAPWGYPAADADSSSNAGYGGCVVSDSYAGTYDTTDSVGASTLTMNFVSVTANIVSGCASASDDSPGAPMGQDEIDGFRGQGLIPQPAETYEVTPTTLVLTPPNAIGGGGFSTIAVTLTKVG
jgi:hypothetical protein